MNGLSASGLADLAGVTEVEVARLVELGILVPRDGTDPFLETDVQKVRLAAACEQAGLPMHLVERIENELEAAGMLGRPERVPAMSFLDLVGYTRLTEEQGDRAAAALAETLAVLVDRSSREHGGVPVKWLGDGVMIHHREPAGAVRSALWMVQQLPEAGLPPAHVGVAAGPAEIPIVCGDRLVVEFYSR